MTTPTPENAGGRVRRPLTAAELDFLRWRIDGSDNGRTLLQSVVVAVFDALLSGLGETYSDYGPDRRLDPRQFAIPQSQWTAIATAVTERARAWGCAIEVGMELVNTMPSAYDDPSIDAPDLSPGDGRPHMLRVDVTREAADEIAACEARVQALAGTYGSSSAQYRNAADTWRRHLAAVFSTHSGARSVVRRDGPLSFHVSTEGGFVFGIVFYGERRTCIIDGCHALVDPPTDAEDGARWRPPFPDAVVLDHDHVPSYPFDAPQPGTWSTHS